MRLTRAALRAEAQYVESETADVASNPHTDLKERVPLGEVSVNAAIEPESEEPQSKKMPPKKGKARGGAKKGAKGRKGKSAEDDIEAAEVLEDERQAAGSPASDAAADELAKESTDDIAQPALSDHPPASPPRAVRMTRRQLAKQEEDLSRSLRSRGPPQPDATVEDVVEDSTAGAHEPVVLESQEDPSAEAQEPEAQESPIETAEGPPAETIEEPATESIEAREPEAAPTDTQEPEVSTPSFEVTSEPEPKTLTSEKPCEEEVTPATSRTPSRGPSRSPSKSPAKSPMRLEESIEAIDALEEALENVGKVIVYDQSGDEKSPKKAHFPRTVTPKRQGAVSKRSPLASQVSRNPSNSPRSLKPTANRSSSLRRSSSVRDAPSNETRKGSGDVVDYLASKRRPISMTFPAPPAPPKSRKAPTQSTFQLPGEAIAAKLKAQKEERLKREAEGRPTKPRPISLPPPPKSTKPPTKSDFRLPGEAIAAKLKAQKEERLRREAEGEEPPTTTRQPISMPPLPKSTKAPTKPTFQLSSEATAAKLKAQKEERLRRQEEAEAAKRAAFRARPAPVRNAPSAQVRQTAASRARETLMSKENAPGVSIPPPPPPQQQQSQRPTSMISSAKRSSIVLSRTVSSSSATSSNRNSMVLLNAGSNRTVSASEAAALKMKGREVFNRDKLEKEARELERREKEEAAKRARAEAAERGRIASREWAEKQRRRLMGGGGAKVDAA